MKTKLLAFLFICLLAGCAQQPAPRSVSWITHQQQLQTLSKWSLTGKLALITKEERHSLNIFWQQSGDNTHITLSTFLGGTILDIDKTSLNTKIINADGKLFFGSNAEELIKQLSGLTIPINALQQWIKGNPEDASYQLNENNQVVNLVGINAKKSSWSINYNDYRNTQGIALPHNLQLKHDDLRLKFAISEWRIN